MQRDLRPADRGTIVILSAIAGVVLLTASLTTAETISPQQDPPPSDNTTAVGTSVHAIINGTVVNSAVITDILAYYNMSYIAISVTPYGSIIITNTTADGTPFVPPTDVPPQTLREMKYSPSCAWVVRTDVIREEHYNHKWAYNPEEERWEITTQTRKIPSADVHIYCSQFSEDNYRHDIASRIYEVQEGSLWHSQAGIPYRPLFFWADHCVLHVIVNQTLTPTCGLSMGEAEQAVGEIIRERT